MDFRIFDDNSITAGFSAAPQTAEEKFEELRSGLKSGCNIVRMHQVHGTKVVCVTKDMIHVGDPVIDAGECDGIITDIPGTILTSRHADCIPLYFMDTAKGVAALSHAGWRGTVNAIATATIDTMKSLYGCDPEDIIAGIGPGIGRCHFEVSEDVAAEFREKLPWCAPMIDKGKAAGKYYIDLKEVNAALCRKAGIKDITVSPVCTYCEEYRCFSYRRNATKERHLAYMVL